MQSYPVPECTDDLCESFFHTFVTVLFRNMLVYGTRLVNDTKLFNEYSALSLHDIGSLFSYEVLILHVPCMMQTSVINPSYMQWSENALHNVHNPLHVRLV